MRDLLRKCYTEVRIAGANTTLFQKRESSIRRIYEYGLLKQQDYYILTRWLLGESNSETEKCLIHTEEIFCKEDRNFTKEDERELHLLCEILVCEYSEKKDIIEFALMILCGFNIEKQLISNIIYKKFKKLIDEKRLSLRTVKESNKNYPMSTINNLIKSINEAQHNLADGESFEYTSKYLNPLINEVGILARQNKYLCQRDSELRKLVIHQKEEMDILWWIMNEWSDLYEKPFHYLNDKEIAIAAPVGLYYHSQEKLFPYAGRQIICYFLKKCEKPEQKYSISEYLMGINEGILDKIILGFETKKIEKVQCIIGALYCMRRCGCEGDAWKGMFKKEFGWESDKVSITPIAFANQFGRELELIRYLAR